MKCGAILDSCLSRKVRDYFMGQLFVMFAGVCVRLEGSYLYCIS